MSRQPSFWRMSYTRWCLYLRHSATSRSVLLISLWLHMHELLQIRSLLQEEITHCAAGIRWLKHLHSLAHESPEPASSAGTTQDPMTDPGTATASGAGFPWLEEARQYPRVELWFHALVRKYFKGSLKVCCIGPILVMS